MNTNRADFLELSQEILGRGALLRFRAPGDSMHPFIENGDILVVEPKSATQVLVGDIILYYQLDGRLMAHRLVRIKHQKDSLALITQGDSLDHTDPPIYPEQILGKVVKVERNGRYWQLNSGPIGLTGRLWARWWPVRRYIRPLLRPGWRLYQRLVTR